MANDSVGARRIDHRHLTQHIVRKGFLQDTFLSSPFGRLCSVLQDEHFVSCRCDVLWAQSLAEQGVCEGALASDELPDDDKHE